ncbi:serine/threonine dehydratase [Streptomyces boninensis]|uniref:serine/threonine dehydratase n=1 Tax=Streptomyces boninensis TaxID=2039455 RepID=UPI003B20E42A
MESSHTVAHSDVKSAAARIAGQVRPLTVAPAGEGLHFALEYLQHTGTFKARGQANFLAAHAEQGALPEAGVVIASGGNAGLACAWAAARHGIPAHVFVPETTPAVKVAGLRRYGADVRLKGALYGEALEASRAYAAASGALVAHAYDNTLVSAGAGTLLPELAAAVPDGVDTVIVSVGGGGLYAGVAAAADHLGIRVVAVEPEGSRALNAALEAGRIIDVAPDSIAADALGAPRVSQDALTWAQGPGTRSVLVPDEAIASARRALWADHRIAVENAAATAYAALTHGAYEPAPGERVAVVLCGANADPAGLA